MNEQTITVPIDFFEHLLKCIARQKYLLTTVSPEEIKAGRYKIIQTECETLRERGQTYLTSSIEETSI